MIRQIRSDLTASVDEKTKASFQRFFKEQVTCYGVKTGKVGEIAKTYFPAAQKLSKVEFFQMCETLLQSDYCEEAFIVSGWVPKRMHEYSIEDFDIFEQWVKTYLNNWAKCDSFCNHTIGDMIGKYSELVPRVISWANSNNRWVKRASAVSFIIPAKRGDHLDHAFTIANRLLTDTDDMVQKGYGWLLKEASRLHQQEVFDYVMANKLRMSRTALRYAIELMPQELRLQAMKRE